VNNFEATYKENYRKMFYVAKKIVSDEDVISDIVQEIFVCYYEKLQKGIEIHNPKSWLLRATINKCIDYINRNKKYVTINAISQIEEDETDASINQSEIILRQAISKLKPQEIKLVLLYSESFSYKEISQIAEIKFSSVGKTLSRTLKKLKVILEKMNYEMY